METSENPAIFSNSNLPKRKRKKTSYKKINNQTRQRLIEMIYIENYPLKEAAKILNINYSTAKTILRIFRIEKRVEKKNADEERELKKLIYEFKQNQENEFNQSDLKKSCNDTFPYKNAHERIEEAKTREGEGESTDQVTLLMSTLVKFQSNLKDCFNEIMTNQIVLEKLLAFVGNVAKEYSTYNPNYMI